ncbi:MAG: hypothetical protein JNL19_04540 [Burkholderiales bacterium]|nr:hypothetical protein [Burkholderiales bacterium]
MKYLYTFDVRICEARQPWCAKVFAALGLVGTLFIAPATAQSSAENSVTVTPSIAVVDTARRITIRGNWPTACLPSTAEIVADASPTPTQLTIRLNEIFAFVACAQVITPFAYEVNYTPRLAGVLPIVVVGTGGQKIAEGRMTTVGKDNATATFNLTGTWFELPTVKSLLMLSHSATNPDALVGIWSVFDSDGKSRALLFHSSVRMSTPSVYQAKLYSLSVSASAVDAACPNYGCPAPGFFGAEVGWVRIDVRSSRELKIEAWMQGAPTDVLAFGSVMTRHDF